MTTTLVSSLTVSFAQRVARVFATIALFIGLSATVEAAFPLTMQTSSLNGRNGFRMAGVEGGDLFGTSVAAGDMNGDGMPDLFVGANGLNYGGGDIQNFRGGGFVVFGRKTGFPTNLDVSTLNGSNGFRLNGGPRERMGASASFGDFNGDGIDDLVIAGGGRLSHASSGSGTAPPVYVVFGTRSSFPAVLSLPSLDGNNGFKIRSSDATTDWTFSASRAGDINGDGKQDLLIAEQVSKQAFVVYGRSSGFPSTLFSADLDGSNGFRITTVNAAPQFGSGLGAAGDINDDGLDDLIIGGKNGPDYVVFGNSAGFPANFPISSVNGSNGLVLSTAAGWSGWSVGGDFDVNGDGKDDMIIGDPIGQTSLAQNNGTAHLLLGRNSGFATNANGVLNLFLEAAAGRGSTINNDESGSWLGEAVSGAGDFNGDGLDDLVVTEMNISAARAHFVFGSNSPAFPPFEIIANTIGLFPPQDFMVIGAGADGGQLGSSVTSLGDLNGDGVDDVAIGAMGVFDLPPNPPNSRTVVVFGGLTGPGEVPVAGLSQSTLDFGNVLLGQTSSTQTITLQNTGYIHTLALGTLTLSGPNASDFALINNTCSNQTLAQDATCTFRIAMTPGAQGARAAQVSIPSNAPTGPNVVMLEGVGFVPPNQIFVDGFENN